MTDDRILTATGDTRCLCGRTLGVPHDSIPTENRVKRPHRYRILALHVGFNFFDAGTRFTNGEYYRRRSYSTHPVFSFFVCLASRNVLINSTSQTVGNPLFGI